LIATARAGQLEIIDPVAHARWSIASANNNSFTFPEISADGTRVIALSWDRLITWKLDLPDTPATTATFLAGLTNAYDKGAGELGWR
jgi:hypothetical protein